jgi:2,3-bisphosphoglycerate-dependent phosphoglycerate mutase
LQGKNKAKAAEKYGDEQVHIWRRSYDVLPPLLSADDEGSAAQDRRYADLDPRAIPGGENLKVTLERVIPFWEDEIAPKLLDGKNVIIAAHGNSLRALTKYIEGISDADIMGVEMATGQPVVYDLDEKLNIVNKTKL